MNFSANIGFPFSYLDTVLFPLEGHILPPVDEQGALGPPGDPQVLVQVQPVNEAGVVVAPRDRDGEPEASQGDACV